jgi:peptidylprolyl isomerase
VVHRSRRALALTVPVLLLALSACGDGGRETAESFDAVEISGSADSAPEVEWNAVMEPTEAETETLVEGDGAELQDGDVAVVNFLLSNGYTHRTPIDSYGADDAGTSVTVGAEPGEPRVAADLVTGVIAEHIEAGMTVGSRVAVSVGAEQAFGDLQNKLGEFGVGNEDGLLLVFDIESVALDGPDGKKQAAPGWAPEIQTDKKDVPTGLGFDGTPEPAPKDALRVGTYVEGSGDPIESGDVVVVDYLGQVYGADEPFDASYSRDEPLTVAIGKDVGGGAISVVEGWSKGLEGVTVGSRVVIQIPPRLGYGPQGNEQAGIGGEDTLYFLVDVLGAA